MTEVDQLSALVAPLVTAAGYELYDVQRNGGTLAVLVDGDDGVDIDDLSQLSRTISAMLDEEDPIPGRYTLEVSSPGVERRLRLSEHFVGAIGEVVSIRTRPDEDGRRRIVGELLAVEGEQITVADRESGAEQRLAITEIDKARTVFEWGPTPRPGGGTKSGGSGAGPSNSRTGGRTR